MNNTRKMSDYHKQVNFYPSAGVEKKRNDKQDM